MAMTFKQFVERCNALLTPETADLVVYQTSPMDYPFRFETDGPYIGEVHIVNAGEDDQPAFNNSDEAQKYINDNDCEDTKIVYNECVVIGAA